MTYSDAERERIIQYLRVKTINHGQLDISQIYVPEKYQVTPSQEYVEVINQFKANLHPIVVRRTNQYGEDQEYELVYGGDWYQAAKLAGLTKIWVWVFDLTDEQIAQVQQLLSSLTDFQKLSPSSPGELPPKDTREISITIVDIIEQKLNQFSNKFSLEIEQKLNNLSQDFSHKINQVLDRLPAPPPPKKNINEVTLSELQNYPNSVVKKHAQAIFNFIQQHRPLSNVNQLTDIKGVGKVAVKALAETYTV